MQTLKLILFIACICLLTEISLCLRTKPSTKKPKAKPKPLSTKIKAIPNNKVQHQHFSEYIEKDQISIRIVQISKSKRSKGNNEVLIRIPKDGEIIVGKNVQKKSQLILQCSAPFPVHFVYVGDGVIF